MHLEAWMIVDLVLAVIILWKLISGIRNGAVHMLGGVVSLGCGIAAGSLCRRMFTDTLAERWLVPGIRRLLDTAQLKLGLQDIWTNLEEILNNAELPGFLKLDVVDKALSGMREGSGSAVGSATELIAQRLAGWLLFLIALLAVTLLVRLLFSGVLEPIIDSLPLVNEANRILGAVLGAVLGVLLAGLLLLVCTWFLPGLWEKAREAFSPDSVERSILMKQYYQFFPGAFHS